MATFEVDIEADEFGICDGRVIAQELVTEALRLLLPYVNADGAAAGRIMHALVLGAAEIVQRDNNENGAPEWGIHYDEELVGSDLVQAMENHVEATKALTQALLERADLGFKENQN